MRRHHRSLLVTAIAAVTLAAVVPARAQTFSEHAPSVKDPLRFSAFAVQMQSGIAGDIEIALERWSTDDERKALVDLVATAKPGEPGQSKLLQALQKVNPRCGFIRTPNSIGWEIQYAYEAKLPDGSRQIVIGTDKPVSFVAAASMSRTLDYPFSLIEMRFPAGSDKGEGKLLAQTALSNKNGRLEIALYGQEAVRLTTITEKMDKPK